MFIFESDFIYDDDYEESRERRVLCDRYFSTTVYLFFDYGLFVLHFIFY